MQISNTEDYENVRSKIFLGVVGTEYIFYTFLDNGEILESQPYKTKEQREVAIGAYIRNRIASATEKNDYSIDTVEIDYDTMVYYFIRNYKIILEDLNNLPFEDLTKLVKRFPYRMSILLKYGDSNVDFEGKIATTKYLNCYTCGKDLFGQEIYEVLGKYKIEFICEKCFIDKK